MSAPLSGGSSPGGAEILEGKEDPVSVASCFCAGISRIVVTGTPSECAAAFAKHIESLQLTPSLEEKFWQVGGCHGAGILWGALHLRVTKL